MRHQPNCPCCDRHHNGPDAICRECQTRREREASEWERLYGAVYRQSQNEGTGRQRTELEKRRAKAIAKTKKHRPAIFARDGHKCVICGSDNNIVLDHIVPISKGGGDGPENLQTLCWSCNSRKGGR